MQRPFTEAHKSRILQLQYFLQKNQYFSKDCLPGIGDALIFQIFQKEGFFVNILVPQRKFYPSLTYWYITMKQFAPHAIKKWKIKSENDSYFSEILDSFRNFISRGRKSLSEIQILNDLTKIQYQYLMNIKLKPESKEDILGYHKKIENQIVEIINYELINDQMKIQFRSDQNNSQKIKREVSLWQNVLTFQIKKIRNKKTGRMRMFTSEKEGNQRK